MTAAHRKAMGDCLNEIIDALADYCRAYHANMGVPVGEDYILGDQGVRDVLRGLSTLLNGELGTRDGATLSNKLHRIAAQHGLADENGEF